jgi:transcriptional regulator GlxA family with amidase domain
LEQFLLTRLVRPLERNQTVKFALQQFHTVASPQTIAAVTDQIGYSPRWFGQLFRTEVGLSPKLYHRIARFQNVLRQVQQGYPGEWADVAQTCGYFDQAHLIHDFQAFSGLTPSLYLHHRGQQLNHIPLDNCP